MYREALFVHAYIGGTVSATDCMYRDAMLMFAYIYRGTVSSLECMYREAFFVFAYIYIGELYSLLIVHIGKLCPHLIEYRVLYPHLNVCIC